MGLFKATHKLDHLTLCLTFPSPCVLHIINLVLHIIAALFQVIIALAAGVALFDLDQTLALRVLPVLRLGLFRDR